MKQILIFLFIVSTCMICWNIGFTAMIDIKNTKLLKEEMELALHDAGLQLDQNQLSNGLIVFDQTKAYEVFRQTLSLNTKTNNLNPTDQSKFKNEIKIVEFHFFDESNTSFPYVHTFPNGRQEIFLKPSIYVVLETVSPLTYGNRTPLTVRRQAAYSYKY